MGTHSYIMYQTANQLLTDIKKGSYHLDICKFVFFQDCNILFWVAFIPRLTTQFKCHQNGSSNIPDMDCQES